MKITATKISVPYLNSLIKRMLLMDTSVYINIDSQNTYSNVYIPSKDVVKSYSIPTSDIFQFDSELGDITIKMSFFSGQKLLSCISYFDPHKLTAEISLYQEDDGSYFSDKITLSDTRLNMEIYCQDQSLGFTYLSEEQISRALDKSTEQYSFTLPREDFTKIGSMLSMDQTDLFSIYGDEYGVHIKTSVFDLVVDDNKIFEEKTIMSNTFKSFFTRIDKESYEISVCENKLVLDSIDSVTKVALNLAITE